jgi:hypothetical protein
VFGRKSFEGKVIGADLSTVNDISEMRSTAKCSSKVKLHLPFFALALFCKRIIRLWKQ